jgi:uncharacterized protein YdeI (YjbR/CyaY-like superfamily)
LACRNSQEGKKILLILYKRVSNFPTLSNAEAVGEALCFGWIDSKPYKRDAHSYYLFFAKRKSKSIWSKLNKERVARLQEQGLMMEAGQIMVNIAKQSGTWGIPDEVEKLILPHELEQKFRDSPAIALNWDRLPPT